MKILVAIKRVIDYSVRVRVRMDQGGIESENIKMSMNPFDAIAVEAAIRLGEAGTASEVVVVSIGGPECQEILRTALAMGADRGILVDAGKLKESLEPLGVAKTLRAVVEREQPGLVIVGKQAIDDDSNQTGQMLAALLGWGQGTFASRIEVSEEMVVVTREIDGGMENIELKLPAVVTTDLRLNEPRYATLPKVMKAKKKPLDTLALSELNIDVEPRLVTLSVAEPPPRQAGIRVATVAELVDKLRNEAKVIS